MNSMSQSILDKTFNVAGALRRGSIGIVAGLFIARITDYLLKSDSLIIFILIVVFITLVFVLWGASEKEVDHTSKSMALWLKISQGLALVSVLGGKPAGTDMIIPEKMTIRRFLWWICFVCNIIAIGFFLYAHMYAISDDFLFLILIVVGLCLYFIRSLALSFLLTLAITVLFFV